MKIKNAHRSLLVALGVALTTVPSGLSAAAAPAADPKKEPEAPKSVFATDPKKGKDPFFPDSERWDPPPPKPVTPVVQPGTTAKPPEPPPKKDPYEHFELKGFVGTGDRRVVTISSGLKNYIMMMGEAKQAVTPNGPYRFKIVRFTETGVVIQVDGEKEKELTLPTP